MRPEGHSFVRRALELRTSILGTIGLVFLIFALQFRMGASELTPDMIALGLLLSAGTIANIQLLLDRSSFQRKGETS